VFGDRAPRRIFVSGERNYNEIEIIEQGDFNLYASPNVN
jgi:hypothetical protein